MEPGELLHIGVDNFEKQNATKCCLGTSGILAGITLPPSDKEVYMGI